MNELMRVMSNLAVNNQQDIDKMIRNLSAMTASMASAADEIDSMLNDFSGDGQTAENMKTGYSQSGGYEPEHSEDGRQYGTGYCRPGHGAETAKYNRQCQQYFHAG